MKKKKENEREKTNEDANQSKRKREREREEEIGGDTRFHPKKQQTEKKREANVSINEVDLPV